MNPAAAEVVQKLVERANRVGLGNCCRFLEAGQTLLGS